MEMLDTERDVMNRAQGGKTEGNATYECVRQI